MQALASCWGQRPAAARALCAALRSSWRCTAPPALLWLERRPLPALGSRPAVGGGAWPPARGQLLWAPRGAAGGAPAGGPPRSAGAGGQAAALAVLAALLLSGTANRVLYRMALVPLQHHVFFLAQFQNLVYVGVYFTILALRFRQGKVTRAMLALPKGPFVLTGGCEALAQLLLMVSAANLPGALLPLVAQTSLVWGLVFAAAVFGTRPSLSQAGGVALVLAGVLLASLPPDSGAAAAAAGPAPASIPAQYVLLAVVSFAFPAAATVLKESIFRRAAQQLGGGQQLDVLVVNSYCSLAQGAWVLLLLPLMMAVKGISWQQLPGYLQEGAAALLGGGGGGGWVAAVPLAYIAVNITFNISALYMVRAAGAVATGVAMACLVPAQLFAFGLLPLPLLEPVQLGPAFGLGTGLLLAGLLLYNRQAWAVLRGGGGGGSRAGGVA